jgi:hypothetical protein
MATGLYELLCGTAAACVQRVAYVYRAAAAVCASRAARRGLASLKVNLLQN